MVLRASAFEMISSIFIAAVAARGRGERGADWRRASHDMKRSTNHRCSQRSLLGALIIDDRRLTPADPSACSALTASAEFEIVGLSGDVAFRVWGKEL